MEPERSALQLDLTILPRGVRSISFFAGLLAVGIIGCRGSDIASVSRCDKPVISRSSVEPSTANVLSVLVSGSVTGADSVMARFGSSTELDNVTPAFKTIGDSALVAVLGLQSSTSYHAQLVASNTCGSTTGDVLQLTTGVLPADLPSYHATGVSPDSGFVVFAAGSYGIVIDNTGRVVWYHRFADGPGLNFQPQPNGRYTARPGAPTGQLAKWIEINPLGDTTRTLTCGRNLQPRMHDLIAQPDGSYWILCDEIRTIDLTAQGRSAESRVTGTVVQKRSATDEILFDWSPFDHFDIDLSVLDQTDLVGLSVNWTHGNSLDLDSDGNLIVSFRNLNEITKIDTHTGAVIWRMGGKQNEFTFANVSGSAFTHQHGMRSVGNGRVLLLDNLGEQSGSRMEVYELDQLHHTARMTNARSSVTGIIALIGGSTQALPSGHTLVSFGNGSGVEEYDQSGSLVWKLDGNPGYVFRATRVKSLYKPGVGDPR